MSDPILPLLTWPEGIAQARIPANDNALRLEALFRPCLGVSNNPGSATDGDVWIVGSAPTGAFSEFQENDIALYHVDPDSEIGGWHAWAPVDGLPLIVDPVRMVFVGGSTGEWEQDPSVSGGGGGVPPVVTESGTSLTADDTNAGNYTRFTNAGAKTYTFDSAETYTVGDEYHGRNAGAGTLTITEAGTFTINPPAGGTLDIPEGGTFTVKIVAADEADLFGVTEQSS